MTKTAHASSVRLYDPSINRFASADHYAGAAANMDLATDPLTGNRYLYAGANPVGMIDDGHAPSTWHPTSWSLTGWQYSGWVSWQFEHFFTANQYRDGGGDVWYHGKYKLDLDVLRVRVRIDSTGRGVMRVLLGRLHELHLQVPGRHRDERVRRAARDPIVSRRASDILQMVTVIVLGVVAYLLRESSVFPSQQGRS